MLALSHLVVAQACLLSLFTAGAIPVPDTTTSFRGGVLRGAGRNLLFDINECTPEPCSNGASCIDLGNAYSCDCLPGYSGTNCETDVVDMCVSGEIGTDGYTRISNDENGFPAAALDDYDQFGSGVAVLGDVDRDGVVDMAVGAPGQGGGAVFLLFMNADNSVKTELKIDANSDVGLLALLGGDSFGSSVAAAGDLDGDEVPDMLVGAENTDIDDLDRVGALYVILLQSSGEVKSARMITLDGLQAGSRFGSSVAVLGDLDGGGFIDLAVGSRGDFSGKGAVHILFNFEDPAYVSPQSVRIDCPGEVVGGVPDLDGFGTSVAALGDFNGDGTPDLAVGAAYHDLNEDEDDSGAVYVLFMTEGGTVLEEHKLGGDSGLGGLLTRQAKLSSVTPMGDLNGDGVTDLAVGAHYLNSHVAGPWQTLGAIYVLLMNLDGSVMRTQQLGPEMVGLEGEADHESYFGFAIEAVRDEDGDGIVELVVGAPYANPSGELAVGDDLMLGAPPGGKEKTGAVYVIEVPVGFVPVCKPSEACADNGGMDYTCTGEYYSIAMKKWWK